MEKTVSKKAVRLKIEIFVEIFKYLTITTTTSCYYNTYAQITALYSIII